MTEVCGPDPSLIGSASLAKIQEIASSSAAQAQDAPDKQTGDALKKAEIQKALTAAQRADYNQKELLSSHEKHLNDKSEHLRDKSGECERVLNTHSSQNDELLRLRPIAADHARLKQANKTKRITLAVCALATGTGGGMMKYNATTYPELAAFGLALILIAAFLQLLFSLFDG